MGAGMNVQRNITLLQIQAVLRNFLFVIPVLVPYYRDVIGLGYRGFLIGEAFFSATTILMEVPTGWLSDIWSRRRTMIVGVIFGFAGFLVLAVAGNLPGVIMAQILIGISMSLVSGTDSALLYDTLLTAGREHEYRRFQGKLLALALYGVGVASVLGGFLYEINHHLPIALCLVAELAALGICFMLVEPPRHKKTVHKHPVADMLDTARYALHGHKEIAGIIILSAVLFATTKVMMWAQQPYYILLDVPVAWFGVLMAAGFMLGGLSSHLGHRFDGRFSNRGVLLSCLGFIVLSCLASGLYPGYHGILLLLFSGTALYGFGWPRVQAAINKNVDSSRRATILSTASFMTHAGQIPLYILTGWAAERHGIPASLLALAAVLVAGGMISALLLRRPGNMPPAQ